VRVLLLHKFYRLTGGTDRYFFETKRILEANGHEVACLATVDPANDPSPYSPYFAGAPDFRSPNLLTRFGSIVKLVYSFEAKEKTSMLIKDFRPEVAHAFGIFSHLSPSVLDACRNAVVPVALSCNDYKHICPNYKLYHHGRLCYDCKGAKFYSAIANKCSHDSLQFSVASAVESYLHEWLNLIRKNVHTFIFASDYMAKITGEFWRNKEFRWKKLANPFDSRRFTLAEPGGEYALVFGRLVEEKGVEYLLDAMKLAPDVKLKIVGDGPEEKFLRRRAQDLGLANVEFAGPMWGEEMDRILARSRFVVVPSVWQENSPYVILQAFAVGKPVVGTNRGGIPELIDDGKFGLVTPADDPQALAAALRKMWGDLEGTRRMGIAAKNFADEEYNDNRFHARLRSIYEEMLA